MSEGKIFSSRMMAQFNPIMFKRRARRGRGRRSFKRRVPKVVRSIRNTFKSSPVLKYVELSESELGGFSSGVQFVDRLFLINSRVQLQSVLQSTSLGATERSKCLLLKTGFDFRFTNNGSFPGEYEFTLFRCKQDTDQTPDIYWGSCINIARNSTSAANERLFYGASYKDVAMFMYRTWKPVKTWKYNMKAGTTNRLSYNIPINKTLMGYEALGDVATTSTYQSRYTYCMMAIGRGCPAYDNVSGTSVGVSKVGLACCQRITTSYKNMVGGGPFVYQYSTIGSTGNEQIYNPGSGTFIQDLVVSASNPVVPT